MPKSTEPETLIILAAPATGKSHLVQRTASPRVVDMDELIQNWPSHAWWDDPVARDRMNGVIQSTLRGFVSEHPTGHLILGSFDDRLIPELAGRIRGWIASPTETLRNLESRRRERGPNGWLTSSSVVGEVVHGIREFLSETKQRALTTKEVEALARTYAALGSSREKAVSDD